MRKWWLHWGCMLAGVVALAVGCASRGGSSGSSARLSPSAVAKQEADEFKAQARQGLHRRPTRCTGAVSPSEGRLISRARRPISWRQTRFPRASVNSTEATAFPPEDDPSAT